MGADEANRQFVSVPNPTDFDDARLRQLFEKYLYPTPQFELFSLQSSDGHAFVLLVFGRQKTRRILAKATVYSTDVKPKLLIREGDLWTKGDSTGKRLAKPEDWDGIFQDYIEREVETQTRKRVDHIVQNVRADERLRDLSGRSLSALPAYLSDDEFTTVVEGICADGDRSRLDILLERFRDELIEGWHSCVALEGAVVTQEAISAIRGYRDSRFLPTVRRLTLLGLLIVKNNGSLVLFSDVMALIQDTYESAHKMDALNSTAVAMQQLRAYQRMQGNVSTSESNEEEHLSPTLLALHSLISTSIIGAYIAKRRRFGYLGSLLNRFVSVAGPLDLDRKNQPIAMWPLHKGWGEPRSLGTRAGRIELCRSTIMADPALSALFGNEERGVEALVQFDFLVEWNSYLVLGPETKPEVASYLKRQYPGIDFSFWPSLIAFDLKYLTSLAVEMFVKIKEMSQEYLIETLLDKTVAPILGNDTLEVFLQCLRSLEDDHERLMNQFGRFGFLTNWPKQLDAALEGLPPRKRQH